MELARKWVKAKAKFGDVSLGQIKKVNVKTYIYCPDFATSSKISSSFSTTSFFSEPQNSVIKKTKIQINYKHITLVVLEVILSVNLNIEGILNVSYICTITQN